MSELVAGLILVPVRWSASGNVRRGWEYDCVLLGREWSKRTLISSL